MSTGWDSAGQLVGGSTYEEWNDVLSRDPRVLWGLVADVVKAVRAATGERRTGRRPAATVGSLDELYDLLFPTAYESRPFPQALNDLLENKGFSQRSFATASGITQPMVSRLCAGKTAPTAQIMERIAYFLDVRPTYFNEYRAAKLGQIITDALLANPQMSAEVARRLVST